MTAFELPSFPGFASSRFGLETNTQRFESPLNRAVQRMVLPGSRWKATYTLPRMNRDQMALWRAFLLKLRGSVNTFNAYDPDFKTPRGNPSGTPLVNGATQTGNTLITDGWTASITVGKAGDYMSFGELKMLTADAVTDGSGNVTLQFEPAIRTSPADNATITFIGPNSRPTCSMVLLDDNQAMWDSDHKGTYQQLVFSGIEVFS